MMNTIQQHYFSNKLQNNLIWGAFISILFSSFIYLEHFGYTLKLLNTITAIGALFLLLYATKRTILFGGFFIGILWFYWIGYSFEYQGVGFMTPIITVFFGIVYLLFFGTLALTKKIYIRALILFALSFVEPFDWNWMQIELLFIESYIGIEKYQLIAVLAALTLPRYIKQDSFKFLPLLFLILAINYQTPLQKESKLNIKLAATDISQEDKWLAESTQPTIDMIFSEIVLAIKNNYDVIVFPESVFPLYMNRQEKLQKILKKYSTKITIIAGALLRENNQNFNVTYMFQNGEVRVAKKMVLVPFGEYIPLPEFARDIINDIFFSGQSDFINARVPTDFVIKGEKFRNAICYEATCQELYEGEVDFIIASSNNAWFAPSIEPTLQNLLLRYYARKNGVTIYHAANYKGTAIVQ